ncbi:MAG: hypothetical protein N2513_06830 [Deltaproteobacteria bacterium]|nr:hypothetical protein [Deltaproteobacteria bacterium]
MLTVLGITLVAGGYYILFFVPSEIPVNEIVRWAIAGQLLSIFGAILIMVHMFLRTK